MTILKYVPENYFQNDKYCKKIVLENGSTVGYIKVHHFKGTLSALSPMYTSIRADFSSRGVRTTDYEFKISYDEDFKLEDFDIEFEKICRKWEKVIKLIMESIEV